MREISKIENGGSLSKCVVLPFPFVLGLCLIKFVNRAVTDKSMGTLCGLSEDFRQKEYQPRRSYSTIVADLRPIGYAQTLKVLFGSCVTHRDGAPPGCSL
jgi:hypothetical protein